jgi:GNAT superfamily N-acetyltransferase
MYEAIQATSPAGLARFCAVPGLGPLDPETLASAHADEHWMLADNESAVARCSLWWSAAPSHLERTVGLIGHYASSDEAAAELLTLACDRLCAMDCALAVGPMDGSTFHRYRLLSERGGEPPFFLEPDNPDSYPAHWTGSGFAPLARYCSALQVGLERANPRIPEIAARLDVEGAHIRSLDLARFEEELRRIYGVTAASFGQSFLASPIAEEEFLALYRPIQPFLRPELVLLAERGDRLLGFLFALPDWLQAQRGAPVDTFIVKTLAVLPECAGQGLAALLTDRCRQNAHALGYTRAIHALMHEDNRSRKFSDAYEGRIIRRYTLYAKRLDGGV